MREPQTPVVFRMFRNGRRECIALFPNITWDCNGRTCSSYMHVGQHGAADYCGVISRSRPAKPDEYQSLQRELESAPFNYQLRVMHRAPKRKD